MIVAPPSWPGLSRPSTFCFPMVSKNVDARDKPGHDEGGGDRPGARHERPEQQPVSRNPCPLAEGSRRLLGRGGARDRLDRGPEKNLRSHDGTLRPLVHGWRRQHLLQRARPPCRGRPRRSGGADPRLAADQHGHQIHLCADAAGGADARGRHAGFWRHQGRPRHPLYADGAGGRVRDAGLRADRRGSFGGVRRLCGEGARDAGSRTRSQN